MRGERSGLFWSGVSVMIAAVLLFCGWLMPIYLGAVDVAVLQKAGSNGQQTGELNANVSSHLFKPGAGPVTPFVIQLQNREKALAALRDSPSVAVQELLRSRALTNTVLFPPSSSASGQAFDGAVALCGLLLDGGHLTRGLSDILLVRAQAAMSGGNSQPMEEILMDELSLGQRFDWRQLVIYNSRINDAETLGLLAHEVRNAGSQLPVLYAAVELSQQPAEVARYLSNFNQTGLQDLARSEQFGAGGVKELLRRDQRISSSAGRQRLEGFAPFGWFFRGATVCALKNPRFALMLKWFFYLSGGFFVALALPGAGRARQPGGVELAREILFASGVLCVALLLSEPFLAQENQGGGFPFRLRLPSVGSALAGQITHAKQSIMNTHMTVSLLTLLLFFVLQGLIYLACLARLNETLRQRVPSRVKLKLLENEDHLFDAGLYLGFVGTIICLILVSLNVLQFSLMAAYSSTSFGIIFVSVLKIFKVRPARRQLLLQAEEENTAAPASNLVATP